MFRVGIVTDKGITAKTFTTKERAENWILEISEKSEIKRADILDQKTKKRERVF